MHKWLGETHCERQRPHRKRERERERALSIFNCKSDIRSKVVILGPTQVVARPKPSPTKEASFPPLCALSCVLARVFSEALCFIVAQSQVEWTPVKVYQHHPQPGSAKRKYPFCCSACAGASTTTSSWVSRGSPQNVLEWRRGAHRKRQKRFEAARSAKAGSTKTWPRNAIKPFTNTSLLPSRRKNKQKCTNSPAKRWDSNRELYWRCERLQ